jgi:hypothetical protein
VAPRLGLFLVAAAFALAGCGGGDDVSDEEQIRTTLDDFAESFRNPSVDACDLFLNLGEGMDLDDFTRDELIERAEDQTAECEKKFADEDPKNALPTSERGVAGSEGNSYENAEITTDGDEASVTIKRISGVVMTEEFEMYQVEDGGWRIVFGT